MKRPAFENMPVHDYGLALKKAVSWLGDRYLLAEPVRRSEAHTSYYAETRRWLDAAGRRAGRGLRVTA